jgi:hypothetical protein
VQAEEKAFHPSQRIGRICAACALVDMRANELTAAPEQQGASAVPVVHKKVATTHSS